MVGYDIIALLLEIDGVLVGLPYDDIYDAISKTIKPEEGMRTYLNCVRRIDRKEDAPEPNDDIVAKGKKRIIKKSLEDMKMSGMIKEEKGAFSLTPKFFESIITSRRYAGCVAKAMMMRLVNRSMEKVRSIYAPKTNGAMVKWVPPKDVSLEDLRAEAHQ